MNVVYMETVPWFFRVYFHTLKVEFFTSDDVAENGTALKPRKSGTLRLNSELQTWYCPSCFARVRKSVFVPPRRSSVVTRRTDARLLLQSTSTTCLGKTDRGRTNWSSCYVSRQTRAPRSACSLRGLYSSGQSIRQTPITGEFGEPGGRPHFHNSWSASLVHLNIVA